ncbi:hypothetical protein ACFL0H_06190 [Thermodesulfobacteriota bacterium]
MQGEDPVVVDWGTKERRLRRISITPQGKATEGNAALRLCSGP